MHWSTDERFNVRNLRWSTSPALKRLDECLPALASVEAMDRSFVAENARELERLKALVSRVTDEDLEATLNPYWSVAGTLAHMAFYDGRALLMAGKLARREPFTSSDVEAENVDWINDSTKALCLALPPRDAARLAVAAADAADALAMGREENRILETGSIQKVDPSFGARIVELTVGAGAKGTGRGSRQRVLDMALSGE